MYCKECGKAIDNDSKFCSFCGSKQPVIQFSDNKNDLSSKSEPTTQNVNASLSLGKNDDKTKIDEAKIEKYDRTYEGDSGATIVVSVLTIISLIIYLTVKFDYESDQQTYQAIVVAINIVWRIVATFWAVNIAKRQNRNTTGWGFFTFFLPNLALFIIGLLKKLYKQLSAAKMSKSKSVLTKDEVSNLGTTVNIGEVSKENSTDNSKVELGGNPSDNLDIGSNGQITYPGVSDNLTYKVIIIEKYKPPRGREMYEFIIKFSDKEIGKLFFSKNIEKYFLRKNNFDSFYYNNKEAAINALHYYLCYNRILNIDRDIYI
jgi:hypothetical protein